MSKSPHTRHGVFTLSKVALTAAEFALLAELNPAETVFRAPARMAPAPSPAGGPGAQRRLQAAFARGFQTREAEMGFDYQLGMRILAPKELPHVTEEMLRRGHSEMAVRGALGANLLRVARQVWK